MKIKRFQRKSKDQLKEEVKDAFSEIFDSYNAFIHHSWRNDIKFGTIQKINYTFCVMIPIPPKNDVNLLSNIKGWRSGFSIEDMSNFSIKMNLLSKFLSGIQPLIIDGLSKLEGGVKAHMIDLLDENTGYVAVHLQMHFT